MRNGVMTDLVTDVVVELGETNLWVTMERAGRFSRPGLVKGAAPGQFPADLRVTEAGRWFWGARHQLHPGDILVSNVLSRVDDPVPMILGGEAVGGAEMVARQIATLVNLVKPVAPSRLTLVHPVDLSHRGRTAVERHLARRLPVGTVVTWISRGAAAVAAAPECADLGAGDRVGVLHVGGSSVEAAVWRQSDPATGDVVTVRVDRGAAGHAVDDVLLAALCSGVGFGRPAAAPNPDLPRLRRECERAKVALSTQTAVDVDVDGVPVRMVRSDVEELSARLLRRQLDTLAAALARSEDDEAPLRMVLLLGGAAAAPSLVQAAGARFEVPVIAVPRVSDAMAKGLIDADKLDQPEPVRAPARQPRSAMAAPNAAQADESDVGALAKARRHWDPVVPLTAIPGGASRSAGIGVNPAAATVDRSAAVRPVARPAVNAVNPAPGPVNGERSVSTTDGPGDGQTPAASSVLAAFTRSQTRLTRIPIPAPTNVAMAAALFVTLAAVPAIGGAMQGSDDPTTWAAANGPGSSARAAVARGLGDGSALAFTPDAGSSSAQWPTNSTATLGPNQLLSMIRPADADDSSSPRRLSAAGASGPLIPRSATTSGTASDSASPPAGGSTPTNAATPTGGSASVGGTSALSSTQPAPEPSVSDPAPTPPPPTNPPPSDPPPASDPPPSDPPTSDSPASDPTPSGDPAPQPMTASSIADVADAADSSAP
jgi:hypothetical protein